MIIIFYHNKNLTKVLGGNIASNYGRKQAILSNATVYFVGGILISCAINIHMMILARFIIGIGAGMATIIVSLYLGEISAPTLRAFLGTFSQVAFVVGMLSANLLGMILATDESYKWRLLLGVTSIISFSMIIAKAFLVESPRWLLLQDPNSVLARINIAKLWECTNKDDIETTAKLYSIASEVNKTSHDNVCIYIYV